MNGMAITIDEELKMIRHILAIVFLLSSLATYASEGDVVVTHDDASPIGLIVFAVVVVAGLAWTGWLMWRAEKRRAEADEIGPEK